MRQSLYIEGVTDPTAEPYWALAIVQPQLDWMEESCEDCNVMLLDSTFSTNMYNGDLWIFSTQVK